MSSFSSEVTNFLSEFSSSIKSAFRGLFSSIVSCLPSNACRTSSISAVNPGILSISSFSSLVTKFLLAVSATKSALNGFCAVISVCNPDTKSATLNSTVCPFFNVRIILLFSSSYSPLTTILSRGRSIVAGLPTFPPLPSLSWVVIT